jgi:UDP-N-acetylmuramoyl-tripeptide--D-alanyl-D-alanine ligase
MSMLDLDSVAHACAGETSAPATRFTAVFSDSRNSEPGGLFVALKGERFDGHDYVADVIARGAAAALVTRAWAAEHGAGLPLVAVDDTLSALGRLAADWRSRFAIPLVAVVGSNGKTTVKEMLSAIFAAAHGESGRLATAGNLNNAIGLPLTLLRLRAAHRAAVIELGMNHPGETAELAAICQPTIALINNAQREHQEFMQSVAAVAAEHGDLLAALPASGTAIINADDEYVGYWRAQAAARSVIDFGLDRPAAVSGRLLGSGGGVSTLAITLPEGAIQVSLHAAGRHNARNALAAAAAAVAAGISLDAIQHGLEAFRPVRGRMQMRAGVKSATLIDDSYNANPDSVRAAIDVLASLPGRRILVLGDMGEVGERAGEFHAEIGGYACSQGIERLYALGASTLAAVSDFGAGARHFTGVDELVSALRPELDASTTVLVKGSRFMRMEQIVDALSGETK